MAKNKKFYAVAIGRSPGVFLSWDECERQVGFFWGSGGGFNVTVPWGWDPRCPAQDH
jgi:Caulimovirus viroplasmin